MRRPRRARLALLGVLVVLGTHAAGAQAPPRPRYAIHARVEPARQRVQVRERISFPNRSRAPLAELVLHLYPNAFAHERTLFMREGGASLRGQRLDRPGGMELRRLVIDGEDRLAAAVAFGPGEDRTQLRVPLVRPLAPGAVVELEIDAEVRMPSTVARMGQAGDFCMVAQFYPKLAKLEADGTFAGHPYHGLGEFYADFADHELTVEAPPGFVIAAPGRRLERAATPAGVRERYRLEAALDVAFAAAPGLVHATRRQDGVILHGYAPPGHGRLLRDQLALAARGIRQLNRELGPYPQARLVLLVPPGAARGADGMEYPGLIVSGSAPWHAELSGLGGVVHDLVTTHELAHQWFPMALGTDEPQAPWLDEGLAQWLGLHLLRDDYGPASPAARALGLPLEPFELMRVGLLLAPKAPSSLLPAHRYRPTQLGPSVYVRPALALETVARAWGRPRLLATLAAFVRQHRFAHPRPQALFTAFDRAYGAGFSKRVLIPLLEGSRPDAAAHAELRRLDLLDLERSDDRPGSRPGAPQPSLLTRVLVLAHALLRLVGP